MFSGRKGVLGIGGDPPGKRVVRASLPFAAALFLVAVCFALGWHHLLRHRGETLRPGLTFACIQPDIPQIPYDPRAPYIDFQNTESRRSKRPRSFLSTPSAGKGNPDLLIWPEAMIDEGVFQDRPLNEAVRDICQTYGGYFLLGSQDFDHRGRAQALQLRLSFLAGRRAVRRVPQDPARHPREFLPFGDSFPKLRQWAGVGMDFTPVLGRSYLR